MFHSDRRTARPMHGRRTSSRPASPPQSQGRFICGVLHIFINHGRICLAGSRRLSSRTICMHATCEAIRLGLCQIAGAFKGSSGQHHYYMLPRMNVDGPGMSSCTCTCICTTSNRIIITRILIKSLIEVGLAETVRPRTSHEPILFFAMSPQPRITLISLLNISILPELEKESIRLTSPALRPSPLN